MKIHKDKLEELEGIDIEEFLKKEVPEYNGYVVVYEEKERKPSKDDYYYYYYYSYMEEDMNDDYDN